MTGKVLSIEGKQYDLDKILEYSKEIPISIMPVSDMVLIEGLNDGSETTEVDLDEPVYIVTGPTKKLTVIRNIAAFKEALKTNTISIRTKWITRDILKLSEIE